MACTALALKARFRKINTKVLIYCALHNNLFLIQIIYPQARVPHGIEGLGMIELIFMACAVGQPNDCSEHAFQYVDISTQTCVAGAQPQLAQWVSTHPNWTIKTWKCQHVSQREIRA